MKKNNSNKNIKRLKKKNMPQRTNVKTKNSFKKKFDVNLFGSIITIVISIATLVISIDAYKISQSSLEVSKSSLDISKNSYLLSSKDMEPNIDFEIDENGINVINNSTDLFKILSIEFAQISRHEIEDEATNRIIRSYIPIYSIYVYVEEENRSDKEIYVDFNDKTNIFGYGFGLKTDKELEEKVSEKIQNEYSAVSQKPKGFAPPSVEGVKLLKVYYENAFKEHKEIYYKYEHIHGFGERYKEKMSEADANELIEQSKLPRFKDIDDYWNIILSDDKYFISKLHNN